MYRLIGLKQCVLIASKNSSGFNYDNQLVQGVFLHSLYQGINEKSSCVRRDLKPHISDLSVTDDSLLVLITKAVSEDEERQSRFGQRLQTVNANAAQVEKNKSSVKMQTEVQANRAAIQELTEQVSSLTKSLEKALTPVVNAATQNTRPITSSTKHPAPKFQVKGKCQNCIDQETEHCTQCFKCGKEGHRAIGCLKNSSVSGNPKRSLGRDHQ